MMTKSSLTQSDGDGSLGAAGQKVAHELSDSAKPLYSA